MTGTILYDYITDNIGYELNPVTKFADILNTNDRNRSIKLLVPRLSGLIINEIESLLRGNVPRGTTRLIESK